MQEAVLEDFKLQLTDCPDNVFFGVVGLVELDGPFLDQLLNALVEGLLLHNVLRRYLHEEFRRKLWQGLELQTGIACIEGVANL